MNLDEMTDAEVMRAAADQIDANTAARLKRPPRGNNPIAEGLRSIAARAEGGMTDDASLILIRRGADMARRALRHYGKEATR